MRFAIQGAPGLGPFAELSPDGGQLAYLEAGEGGSRVLVHALASGEARQVSATARAGTPLFWSPDSRFVGFADDRTLRRVDVATGAAEPVCDTPVFNGGTWNGDDLILFCGRDGIMQVAAGGGTPSALTTVDDTRGEFTHAAPWFLPDGRHFLYLRASLDSGSGGIYVGAVGLEPAAQESTRLLATERPAVYARSRDSTTGRLFFMQGSRLLAQAFDDARLELAGEPTVVAEDAGSYDVRWRSFSVSDNGIAGGAAAGRTTPCHGSTATGGSSRPSASTAWTTRGIRVCRRTKAGSPWSWPATSGCSTSTATGPPSASRSTSRATPSDRRSGRRTVPPSSARATDRSTGCPPTAAVRRSRSASRGTSTPTPGLPTVT